MLATLFLVSLAVLEIGLFLIGPVLQNSAGPGPANVFYILLRAATIILFSFFCAYRFKKNIHSVLSLTGALIFFDQVVFKSLWLILEMKRNPAAWQDIDKKAALYNSAFSYVVSLPVVLLLAFVGVLLAWKKSAPRSTQTR